MDRSDWIFWFQAVGALGSLATFGAFLFLWRRDKNKQDQVNRLTAISETWSRLYQVERSKHRLALFPELRLITHAIVDTNQYVIQISNVGQSAIIDEIIIEPEGAAFAENRTMPFNLDKDMSTKIRVSLTNTTHLDDIHFHINYYDKGDNEYTVTFNKGVLTQPVEFLR